MANTKIKTCCVTGEQGTKEEFFRAEKKWFKSEDIYIKDKARRQLRIELVDYICREFLDYSEGQPFPPILPRKLKELEYYDNAVILKTFKQKAKDIHQSFSIKQFDTDVQKVSYMFAIIKNSIADVQRQMKYAEKQEQQREIIFDTDNIDGSIGSQKAAKDISCWLEGDAL